MPPQHGTIVGKMILPPKLQRPHWPCSYLHGNWRQHLSTSSMPFSFPPLLPESTLVWNSTGTLQCQPSRCEYHCGLGGPDHHTCCRERRLSQCPTKAATPLLSVGCWPAHVRQLASLAESPRAGTRNESRSSELRESFGRNKRAFSQDLTQSSLNRERCNSERVGPLGASGKQKSEPTAQHHRHVPLKPRWLTPFAIWQPWSTAGCRQLTQRFLPKLSRKGDNRLPTDQPQHSGKLTNGKNARHHHRPGKKLHVRQTTFHQEHHQHTSGLLSRASTCRTVSSSLCFCSLDSILCSLWLWCLRFRATMSHPTGRTSVSPRVRPTEPPPSLPLPPSTGGVEPQREQETRIARTPHGPPLASWQWIHSKAPTKERDAKPCLPKRGKDAV